MSHQVYDSLVFRDQAMKLAQRLATAWKITATPTSGSSSCARA